MRRIVSWGVLASLLLVTVAAMAQSRDEVAVRSVIERLIKSFNSVEPITANRFLADLAPAAGLFYPPFSQKEASASEVRASLTGISILSFPFTRKPMPATLSCQPQTALASLR